MRGLLKASLLLAPALASAFVVPTGVEDINKVEGARIADHSFALIGVEIPSTSDDWREALAFRLDVLPSEEACGFGNVTVDGQVLPQTLKDEVATGKGSITTDRKNIVIASWSFHCIKVNGQPDSQLLKFVVDMVDGTPTTDAGFSALFRQTGSTEILNIETDLSTPDEVAANPNPEDLQPVDYDDYEFPHFSIEQEMDELHWLRAQMRELEYLIDAKERAIAEHASAHFKEDIRDCDNLKCVAKAVVDKARKAAHHVINKIHGHGPNGDHGFEEEEFGHFPKPKFPHWWPKHGKHGNHTCGHPKHGNHTAPPHWRKPHHRPLPICRFPPPPPRHCGPPPPGPPGKSPHHGPPPPPPHCGPPPPPCGPPPPGPPGKSPHHGPPSPPPHCGPPPPPPHCGPPKHGDLLPPPPGPPGKYPHHRPPPPGKRPPPPPPPHCGPPPPPCGPPPGPPGKSPHHRPPPPPPLPHCGPPKHGDFPPPPPGPPGGFPEDGDVPPHGPPEDFPHDGLFGGPRGPPYDEEGPHGPPGFESEAPFHLFDDESGPPGPPDRHSLFGGPGPHHNGLGKAFHIFKFAVIGCLISLLLIALHRRGCTSQKRADRQARCEERHQRRAFRRAARKYMISRFLARISGNESESDSDSDDYEVKRQALLASAEDGMSTTMTEEITEFRNAAEVVDDIVAASSRQSRAEAIPIASPVSEDRPLIDDYDIGSQVGDGEELPAYEDNDGSEMSSVVTDGFRYTPGSTDYSPSQSPAGSVCDILGPDTKQ